MIDTALISISECANDGTVVHLYCDNKCGTWIAYGISAYMLYYIGVRSFVHISCGFSDEIQIPYAKIDNCLIGKLFRGSSKEYDKDMIHLKFRLSESINLDNYVRWTKQMKNCM